MESGSRVLFCEMEVLLWSGWVDGIRELGLLRITALYSSHRGCCPVSHFPLYSLSWKGHFSALQLSNLSFSSELVLVVWMHRPNIPPGDHTAHANSTFPSPAKLPDEYLLPRARAVQLRATSWA